WIAAEGRLPVNELSNPNKFFGNDDKKWMKYQQATGELANLPINIREEKHIYFQDRFRVAMKEHVAAYMGKKNRGVMTDKEWNSWMERVDDRYLE
ncbi:hypothetical protein CON35_31780, partial [Bacillus cereus]